jgi:hypothetical protein
MAVTIRIDKRDHATQCRFTDVRRASVPIIAFLTADACDSAVVETSIAVVAIGSVIAHLSRRLIHHSIATSRFDAAS